MSAWRSLALVAILILLTGCFQSSGPPGGRSCGPAPTTQVDLSGATAISASDTWVVGLYQNQGPAVPFTEHWDGHAWTPVDAPAGPWVQAAHLNAVSAAGTRDVWAVGAGQNTGEEQTLIERWDGTSWAIVASPNASVRTNELAALDVISANDAWAVGDYLGTVRDFALTEHWVAPIGPWSMLRIQPRGSIDSAAFPQFPRLMCGRWGSEESQTARLLRR